MAPRAVSWCGVLGRHLGAQGSVMVWCARQAPWAVSWCGVLGRWCGVLGRHLGAQRLEQGLAARVEAHILSKIVDCNGKNLSSYVRNTAQ